MRRLPLIITLVAGALGWTTADWREASGGGGTLFTSTGDAGRAAPSAWPPIDARLELDAALASSDPRPLVLYGRTDAPQVRSFETAAAASPQLAAALAGVRLVVVDAHDPIPARVAEAGLLRALPAFVAVAARPGDGPLEVVDAAEPLTGALFEPLGLAVELERIASGSEPIPELRAAHAKAADPTAEQSLALVARLEAAGLFEEAEDIRSAALDAELRPNAPLHRDALLRAALAAHVRPAAADAEGGPIEQHLIQEADPTALYRGWSLLSSSFAAFADTVDDPGVSAEARELGRERWLRRVRRSIRKGYKPCPEERLVPFASLLLERFALDPEDLDSIDRSFCRAVARRITRSAPETPWAARAQELFPQR